MMGATSVKRAVGSALTIALLFWIIFPFHMTAKAEHVRTTRLKTEYVELTEFKLQDSEDEVSNEDMCAVWAAVCVVAGTATAFGGLLAAITGPTAMVCLLDGIFDLSGCQEYALLDINN